MKRTEVRGKRRTIMKRTSIIIIPVICLILAIFAAGYGKIGVRYAQGEYDADSFPEDAQEITVSGKDSAKVDGIEPGSYTVLVTATDDLNGTAVIR